jgi:hypothetical protein
MPFDCGDAFERVIDFLTVAGMVFYSGFHLLSRGEAALDR